jgi:hypothetical protein
MLEIGILIVYIALVGSLGVLFGFMCGCGSFWERRSIRDRDYARMKADFDKKARERMER